MQLNVTVEIPEKDLCDLLTTAWEGGSDYWSASYDARAIRRGGDKQNDLSEFDVVQIEYQTPGGDDEFNEPVKQQTIAPADIGNAIAIVLNRAIKVGDHIIKDLENNIQEVGLCDADTADVLLQVATFGDIIYG